MSSPSVDDYREEEINTSFPREALYSQQNQDRELTVAQIMSSYCQIQTEIEESRENH